MSYREDSTSYRDLILGINKKVPLISGKSVTAINFDNAATTPPFKSVMEDVVRFAPWYSSIHRGEGFKSQLTTRLYEESRDIVSKFVKADCNNTVIYVKNSTEAFNTLSNLLYESSNKNVILTTDMEHHSNDLPWRDKFIVDYISIDASGRLSLEDLEAKLNKYNNYIKLVTITGASNVTGYKNPIYNIAKLVHRFGSKLLVDGAQLIPHAPFIMNNENSEYNIDFLIFSAHKMYAPFGIGVLIGPKDILDNCDPDLVGGGTVDIVTHDFIKWAESPQRHEAGSPNVIGTIALASAIKTLSKIGMANVEHIEKKLTAYAISQMKNIPNLKIYCDTSKKIDRVSIIPFNIDGIHHATVAKILSYEWGISVRSGCFCAQPYMASLLNISSEFSSNLIANPDLNRPGMVRISFGLYNSYSEIDILSHALNKISSKRDYYILKYQNMKKTLFDK
ncbi:aminotransferase class V-fold PLP-dependent enzyme [Clostridium tagluense]|uniref:aminotransferase class V-fold PLP-dependent enzyme n=1 Tax=Clostridium tagluense TaxID=360422 RepID=UPI001CF18593|nr:aminotransferase class V-fold PLP-dependent enzyme [Clostridium tagluense]MCB2309676.1 aminotransferase class V-fold PLP-dependent enzyme [Clostridium tagluense]MCB2314794.1 aminotransferase class V-fold PLP-dependent enzyme [Clostridium tagluense]MCB2319643.1 aminotransferase class V-fold PLP-dependent enzyme [Clostridium tagluense]MCB2324270.1 aminotransferase class V-fold PLP-dependent enzyme [Clostridium tagluense]MCB2329121.1 aminotransferase class V-fold PLP-dependent enzyme [Clostrid